MQLNILLRLYCTSKMLLRWMVIMSHGRILHVVIPAVNPKPAPLTRCICILLFSRCVLLCLSCSIPQWRHHH
jgi:hypothetical protein